MSIDYSGLPEHMRGGMKRYLEHGIMPGDFLTAVLRNDLMEAMGRADETNLYALPSYGRFLYYYAPRGSYGSPENVKAWVEARAADRAREKANG